MVGIHFMIIAVCSLKTVFGSIKKKISDWVFAAPLGTVQLSRVNTDLTQVTLVLVKILSGIGKRIEM
jgi:hypothetical protein